MKLWRRRTKEAALQPPGDGKKKMAGTDRSKGLLSQPLSQNRVVDSGIPGYPFCSPIPRDSACHKRRGQGMADIC